MLEEAKKNLQEENDILEFIVESIQQVLADLKSSVSVSRFEKFSYMQNLGVT